MDKFKVFADKKEYSLDTPMTLEKIKDKITKDNRILPLAIVDNEIRELTYIIDKPCSITFLDLTSSKSQKAYKRSLSFLFIKAVHDIAPEAEVELCHTLSKGQYCEIKNIENIDEKFCKEIKQRMVELVKEDIPFIKQRLSLKEARDLFKKLNRMDKILLLENIDKDYINIYKMGDYIDYFYSYLTPSTGYLKIFDIVLENNGVVLLCPDKNNPDCVRPHNPQPKLINIFNEAREWQEIMNVGSVGQLNQAVKEGQFPLLVSIAEALHENKIAKIADQIAAKNKRVILIAGPSSSGKTSFSKRLSLQLMVNKLHPIAVSLDNYFLEKEKSPRDKFGNYDFESITALDLDLFNNDLTALLNGNEVLLPTYNFKTGKREYNGKKLRIDTNQPIVLEGIHGLNNLLTSSIPDSEKFKIYISPITQLNLDSHNRISSTDCRLIRRIIRDFKYRGHNAASTIKMWPSVRNGEEKNIFPYQENADMMFNSSLIYELTVLKRYAVPLLKAVSKDEDEYMEANRLLSFLVYFKDIDKSEEKSIPLTSITREFIGGQRLFEY